jgi:hypothetical protein
MLAPAIELTTGARRFVIGDGRVASRLYLNPDLLDDILTPIPAALRGAFAMLGHTVQWIEPDT